MTDFNSYFLYYKKKIKNENALCKTNILDDLQFRACYTITVRNEKERILHE